MALPDRIIAAGAARRLHDRSFVPNARALIARPEIPKKEMATSVSIRNATQAAPAGRTGRPAIPRSNRFSRRTSCAVIAVPIGSAPLICTEVVRTEVPVPGGLNRPARSGWP